MAGKKNTVVIGCKLPAGLVIRGADKQFIINGSNSSVIIGGFGITEDVPSEIWDDYAKAHAKSKLIQNGLIFAVNDKDSAKDAANERSKQKTGFEQASDAEVKALGVEKDSGI